VAGGGLRLPPVFVGAGERKRFFFEKKNQKTFGILVCALGQRVRKFAKVFASFFKKKRFSAPPGKAAHLDFCERMSMKMKWIVTGLATLMGLCGTARAADGVGAIMARGKLNCGVVIEPLDWNKQDLHGSLVPLDTEMCRAVSAALFGVADRYVIQSYNVEQDAITGLEKGASDIAVGVTAQAAAGARGVRFSVPIFQDGQGFMVHKAEGIHDVADIAGHKLCYIEDTDNDPTVLAFLASRGVRPIPFGFQEEGEMDAAIMDRHCQLTSAFISKLAEARSTFRNHQDYVFLPDMLTLVPVTIASGGHDPRLAAIVDYTISVLLQAEFLAVTQADARAPTAPHAEDKRMQRLTGEDWITAQGLRLPHDWSRKIVAAVGNYGEIYARTLGPGTPFDLPRGLNALWTQGGLMAPLPLQ
jgi:general L-amino acid transport system substrate-binding protein